MRFSKDHIRFIRNQYVIHKAFCHFSLALIFSASLFFSFYLANEFLSIPPSEGSEGSDYSETRDQAAKNDLFKKLSGESEENTETDQAEPQPSNNVANKFIREKRDLNAQEGMWKATNLLGFLTVIQAWIGLIAVAVVAYTLLQTGEILREARQATYQAGLATKAAKDTVAETRIATFTRGANVLLEAVEIGANPEKGTELNLVIKYCNFGETPAKNIMVNAGVRGCDGATGIETLPVSIDMTDGPTGIYMGPSQASRVMQSYRLPVIQNLGAVHRDSCFVAVVIRYETIFKDDPDQAKDLEFYCRIDFKAYRKASADRTNPVVAKGGFKSLTPNINRINVNG